MRPRPEGRGELRQTAAAWGLTIASMRPRPEGRGEPLHNSRRGGRSRGFNAATTRRPWRTGKTSLGRGVGSGFNAATTRRPWRTRLTGERGGEMLAGFNAATTRRPWRTMAGFGQPGCNARCFNAATTRRPWRTDCVRNRYTGSHAVASMRPRPEGRGEPTDDGRRPRRPLARLQCGHDPKAVENADAAANADEAVAVSFNAATTRRPWRTTWSMASVDYDGKPGFNAATTRRPWRTGRLVRTSGGQVRFNAATTRRPWRTRGSRSTTR